MNYNTLRLKKVKDRTTITQLAGHNFRTRTQKNIDSVRTKDNVVMFNKLKVDTSQPSDLQAKITKFYSELGIVEKAGNVLMLESVVSASPAFFKNKSKAEVEGWAASQVEFMQASFGNNLKLAVLHVDEKTPHLHFVITTENESVKKYKNQKGEFFKKTWSLNAKRYDPEFCLDLHDKHALHNKQYKLHRGVKGSMANHNELKDFYKLVNQALNSDYQKKIEDTLESLHKGLLTKKVSIDDIRATFAPMINDVLKQNKALRTKFQTDLKAITTKLAAKDKELLAKQKKLDDEEKSLKDMRNIYTHAIKKGSVNDSVIVSQQSEIDVLKAKLERFEEAEQSEAHRYERGARRAST